MPRLIDVDALEDAKFHSIENWTPIESASWQRGWNDAIDAIISNAPTVDPVKHGHWIAHGKAFMGATIEACSECGELLCGYNKAYCPNCGAKMKWE